MLFLVAALVFGLLGVPAVAQAAPVAAVPDSAPDEQTAVRFAEQGHKTVKVDSATTEASETVANRDGSLTRTTHQRPVRVRGAGGTWVAPDATLAAKADGALAPKAAATGIALSGGGDQPLLKLSANGVTTGLTWPGRLPKPVVTGSTATYPEVLPGVDLKVETDTEVAHEVLVVKTREAAKRVREFQLGVPVTGGKLSMDADGTMHVRDTNGADVYTAPPATMWDSSGYTPGDRDFVVGPDPGGRTAEVAQRLTGNTLTLTPDAGLLGDGKAAYPLYIDPQWTPPNCVCTRNHYLVQYACGPGKTAGDTKWDSDDYLRTGFVVDNQSSCSGHQVTARSYVELSMAGLGGKQIYAAELDLGVASAISCGTKDVLLMSGAINGPTPFGQGPPSISNIAEIAACGSLSFNIKDVIDNLAHNGDHPTFTFGLLSPNENDQNTWKRFNRDVAFSVTYNSVPNTPQNLQLWNGTRAYPCAQGANRPAVGPSSTGYTMRANVSDPDGGQLYAGFRIYNGPGTPPVVWDGNETGVDNVLSDGNRNDLNAVVKVPSNEMNQDGHVYSYDVHATDGRETTWVPPCEIELDLTAPNAPGVSSQVYPAGSFGGGPGRLGDFTFTTAPAVTKVDHYVYRMDNTALPSCDGVEPGTVKPAAPDGPATAAIAPAGKGPHVLSTWTCNRAGTPSGRSDYQFSVKDAAPPAAAWQLEGDGASQNPGLRYAGQGSGNYTTGKLGQAVALTGQVGDLFTTQGRVLDTGASYTVSGWANLSTLDGTSVLVSQEGSQNSAFALLADGGRWKFALTNGDGANPALATAVSTSAAATGVWTHLTGVYDGTAKTATLYVNGTAEATVPATGWSSTGQFVLGGAKNAGQRISLFRGAIDEVAVYDHHALTAAEVSTLSANGGVPAGATREYKLDGDATDATGNDGKLLLPQTGVTFGTGYSDSGGQSATDSAVGHGEGQGLVFAGLGMAETTTPVIDTTQSFTVSAWAKPADKNAFYAVAGQSGINQTAFQLRYDKNVDRWIMGLSAADHGDDGYTWAIGKTVPAAGIWTHLTGVYDRAAGTISVYVNGVLDGQVAITPDKTWNAPGGFSVGGVRALGGNAYFFKGTIDQVQVWSRALPGTEVAGLANTAVLRANYQLAGDTKDGVTGATATPSGGVNLASGVARFDNSATGQIEGPRPQDFRGDRSFSVEAWVKHAWTADDAAAVKAADPKNTNGADPYARAAVGMNGPQFSPFLLGYRGESDSQGNWHGQWSWLLTNSISNSTSQAAWTALTPGTADDNTWTHLTGTYDAVTGKTCLHATTDARVLQDACLDGAVGWNGADALADLFLGRGVWTGVRSDLWYGDVRGARVYSGVLDQQQINVDSVLDHP
ncbi:LamG domain-containing protein [Streptomyces sp. MN03-5084-2B]|nr:LamG domain-containing protein [Streptomyces sp. MN03-5084-2B]